MKDVVFVVPARSASLYEDFQGTLLLATILKQHGLAVHIHHFYEVNAKQSFDEFVGQTVDKILSHQPKIVSFYCRGDCYLANLMIARELKERCPQLYIVLGGPQADASAEATLEEIPWVDFCCCGEGESTVYPLFSALLQGQDYSAVAGLVYRAHDGNIVHNENPPMTADLDELPYIDFDFLDPVAVEHSLRSGSAATIEAGRGCPFNCAYCSSTLFWKRKFRLKSAKRIVDEMVRMHEQLGVRKFIFQHDLFTVNKKKVMEFTQEMKRRGTDFVWACSSRADTLDEATIDAMAEVGLKSVFIGVESGSERMQKEMNKNLKVADILRVTAALRKNNIKVRASFIYALPEETEEDLEQTLQVAYRLLKMGVKSFQMHLCVIFPGTEYYRRYADEIVLSTTQSDVINDFGFEQCQDFIRQHQRLFSFCYEYPSELRTRFAPLTHYMTDLLLIYEQLERFAPEVYAAKPMTQIALELMGLYDSYPLHKDAYAMGADYAARYCPEDIREQAVTAFTYLSDYEKAAANPKFNVSLKNYPLDLAGMLEGKPLSQLSRGETMVSLRKDTGKLNVSMKTL